MAWTAVAGLVWRRSARPPVVAVWGCVATVVVVLKKAMPGPWFVPLVRERVCRGVARKGVLALRARDG